MVNQNKRGRPATGRDPVSAVRLPHELTSGVDAWAAKHEISRSEAIRRLVELGLASATTGRAKKSAASPKPSELAGAAIDKLADTTAPTDERASRERRLLKGPEEFRDVRKDRKIKK